MNTSRFSTYWNRRTILLIMAVSLALLVAACDGSPTPTNTSPAATNTPTTAPTATPTTAPTATATSAPTATPTPTPSPRTGLEEVRTSVIEADFEPGASRSPTKVWIYGSGFEPGQEVYVLITDASGAQTDITVPAESQQDGGGSVWPLIANDQGAWATMWTIGRFSRDGVGTEGQFSLTITDTDFNILATTPLALCNNENRAEGEEMPNYCSGPAPTPEPGTPEPGTAEPTATP